MEKRCLIFMPLIEPIGYSDGHFNRVFDYIISPSCKSADFTPVRVDDYQLPAKNIIDIDMVLCDLSSVNTHALYIFAVRQALNLPVILIKDTKTAVDHSMHEFMPIEYDDSLRIDTVQKAMEVVSNGLRTTYAARGEASLLKRLNIGPEQTASGSYGTTFDNIYKPREVEKPAQEVEMAAPVFVPLPDFVGDTITEKDIEKLKAGDSLYHTTYGKGVVTAIKIMANEKMANIQFDIGIKLLVLGTSGIFRKIIG